MTKFAKLYEEEKIEAVNEANKRALTQVAMTMLTKGEDIHKIMEYTMLTRNEIEALRSSMSA